MVRHTDYGPRWEQEDYDRIKEALSDLDASFNGPGRPFRASAGNMSVEIDVGNRVEIRELRERANDIFEALDEAGMRPRYVDAKAGYRGACDQALLLDVEFDDQVYDDDTCNGEEING